MTEYLEPKVGAYLRMLRDERGLSLRALAEKSGLSINAISLIERGENSPTVSTLHRLASALGVQITQFFQEPTRQTIVHVKRNAGLSARSETTVMESLGIGLFNQQLEPFRIRLGPGNGNISDPITHQGEEFVHCLEGEVVYSINGQKFGLEPGDSLLFDATQAHTYFNPLDIPAEILLVLQATQEGFAVQQLHLE